MSNQHFSSIKYTNRSQQFYNDFFASKDANFFKQKVRDFKIFSGTHPDTKKRISKSLRLFFCTAQNAPNKITFRVNLNDIFENTETYTLNMDWVKKMDRLYHNYCFSNGCSKFSDGKVISCNHTTCDFVYTEMMNMVMSNIEFPFQEFLYVNLSNDFVKINQAIKVQTFPSDVVSKLDTPFFKIHSNGGVIISCNMLSLVPGINIFKLDISNSEVFEVSVTPHYSPNISFAQVSNGCLHLHAINSLDMVGDIATVSKNVCIPTPITDLLPASVLNIKIKDFKNQTYPIRNKTDRVIETLLYPLGVFPCKVNPRLACKNYNTQFDDVFEQISQFLGLDRTEVLSFGDLNKMQRFLKNYGGCSSCQVKLPNTAEKKLYVLDCWDSLCQTCFSKINAVNDCISCPINMDHCKTDKNKVLFYDNKIYLEGLNKFLNFYSINTLLEDFLKENADDKVFSYTLYYNHTPNDRALVEKLMGYYAKMKFEKLDIEWNIVSAYFNESALQNFTFGCRFVDDTRPLSCIVTKPTFTNVDISRRFLEIFKNENITALDVRIVDFNKDSDYGVLYDVNNTKIWSKYWRDYLGSDYGIAYMIRTPSIAGFSKYIEKVMAYYFFYNIEKIIYITF